MPTYLYTFILHSLLSRALLKFSAVLVFLLLCLVTTVNAQTNELFPTGSYIINMGSTTQTNANALNPYSLIYDLLKNNKIPVKWVISQTKLKDGTDFIYNGISYKGGTFIIPAQFINANVNAKITSYGVTGNATNQLLANNVGTIGNALVPGLTHADPVAPFTHQFPNSPVAQYMGLTEISQTYVQRSIS